MPVLDPFLAQLPAELDKLAIAIGRKIDESLERTLELDAHPVQACDRLEELELGAANRIARLLMPIAIVGAGARTLRFVLGDTRLILELG